MHTKTTFLELHEKLRDWTTRKKMDKPREGERKEKKITERCYNGQKLRTLKKHRDSHFEMEDTNRKNKL